MSEQQILQKKKRKRLLISYDSIDKFDKILTIEEISKKLLKCFKYHIGKENGITPYELFVFVYEIKPENVDVYKREYLWGLIKKILSSFRTINSIFVINDRTILYVLRTQDEYNKFSQSIDRHIKSLELIKHNAKEWIKHRMWEDLK